MTKQERAILSTLADKLSAALRSERDPKLGIMRASDPEKAVQLAKVLTALLSSVDAAESQLESLGD